MKRLLLAGALAALAFFAGRGHAQAACSVPNTFTNGTIAQSALVNANFAAVVACVNNISGANIGPGGLWASNIIPTTVGQATFGGSGAGVNYTFPGTINLPTIGVGCLNVAATTGALTPTGSPCPTIPLAANLGGTGTTGGSFVNGQCFFWNGTTFATQPCATGGVTTITALAPLTVDNTDPTAPVLGMTVPLATQYGGLGVTGSAFAAGTTDCIGGKFASGTATVSWLPCLMTKSSWNGSSYVVTAQNDAPLVFTAVPITFGSCAAASGPSQAACVTVNVPIPTTPTAWGYTGYSTWGCEAHLEATGSGGGVPMVYTAVVSGSNVVVSVFNPYSFAISSSFSQTVGGHCEASATHP